VMVGCLLASLFTTRFFCGLGLFFVLFSESEVTARRALHKRKFLAIQNLNRITISQVIGSLVEVSVSDSGFNLDVGQPPSKMGMKLDLHLRVTHLYFSGYPSFVSALYPVKWFTM
jgi:hypothetical protein